MKGFYILIFLFIFVVFILEISAVSSSDIVFKKTINVDGEPRTIKFSNNNKYLVAGNLIRSNSSIVVRVFYTKNWTLAKELKEPKGNVESIHFSPDDEYLYICSEDDPGLFIYDTKNWTLVQKKGQVGKWCLAMHPSPDGKYLAYGGSDTNVLIIKPDNWDYIILNNTRFKDHIFEILFSPDSSILVVGEHSGDVWVYDADENFKEIEGWKRGGQVNSICWGRLGEFLFLGGENPNQLEKILIDDIKGISLDNYTYKSEKVSDARSFECDVSQDNYIYASGTGIHKNREIENLLKVYYYDNFTSIANLSLCGYWVNALDISNNMNWLAAGSYCLRYLMHLPNNHIKINLQYL
jgi:WD40 repeat protein